jgi:hypothetical protein
MVMVDSLQRSFVECDFSLWCGPTEFPTAHLLCSALEESVSFYSDMSALKTELRSLSPQANYTDRATATCR